MHSCSAATLYSSSITAGLFGARPAMSSRSDHIYSYYGQRLTAIRKREPRPYVIDTGAGTTAPHRTLEQNEDTALEYIGSTDSHQLPRRLGRSIEATNFDVPGNISICGVSIQNCGSDVGESWCPTQVSNSAGYIRRSSVNRGPI